MQTDYRTYTIDELSRDTLFRQWVILRDPGAEQFWENWVAANPDKREKIQVARAFLEAFEEQNSAVSDETLSGIVEHVVRQRPSRTVSLWRKTTFRIAASILLFVSFAYFGVRFFRDADRQAISRLRQINPSLVDDAKRRTNTSTRVQRITLEDGSIVDLYPNSTIQYPAHFQDDSREIYLKGKAFFSISRNPKKPFWVYTSTVSTQVLGTSFTVSAVEGASQAKVEVKSGRVSVYRLTDVESARKSKQKERAGVILTANQQVSYANQEGHLVKSVVAQPAALTMIEPDAFKFENTPIADVFNQLETTYGLNVVYDRQTMNECYVTANLSGESLFAQLKLICTVTRSSYEIVDGQIVIHSIGCQ
ncbi:FecR domain-containing protein [Dyadobacter sp. CY107]|uniref:FecR family protein n=1 Tax=Dyadobacter fanqingshengii TaxID=2906443 RepID=UPI001F398713|nr:FecR family protein [Dyadobacter fanqingshengii]MCF2505219.1 FecR domain-containing protein [Dyadobacter fanqingshengii]